MTPPTTATGHDGLWRRYVAAGEVLHAAWLHARSAGEWVGTCRLCGDYLIPLPPDEHAGRIDYEAACRNRQCRYVLLAPGGRVMGGSAAKSHTTTRSTR